MPRAPLIAGIEPRAACRVRRPAVSGYYYPADPEALARTIDRLMPARPEQARVLALIAPHGSFQHAGAVLGAAFGAVAVPGRCMLLGPSHLRGGAGSNLMTDGAYRTPLGDAPIDVGLVEALRVRCPFLATDADAQRGEHALEVLVPFLQRLAPPALHIVPMLIGAEPPARLTELGEALAEVVRTQDEPVLLIASADGSSDGPAAGVRAKDEAALAEICALDLTRLLERHAWDPGFLCGAEAVLAVVAAARALGATRGEVVAYCTSADAGGDPDSATGYAAIRIH